MDNKTNAKTDATAPKPIYAMRYRPVSGCTLPPGITTTWVRTPQVDGHIVGRAFPDLDRSTYPYGEFTTNRELTDDELESYQVERVDPAHKRNVLKAELEERIDKLRTERAMFAHDPEEVTTLTQMIDAAETQLEELDTAEAPAAETAAAPANA